MNIPYLAQQYRPLEVTGSNLMFYLQIGRATTAKSAKEWYLTSSASVSDWLAINTVWGKSFERRYLTGHLSPCLHWYINKLHKIHLDFPPLFLLTILFHFLFLFFFFSKVYTFFFVESIITFNP